MSLKLIKRNKRPYWYIRGTVRGQQVYESTRVTSKATAQEIMAVREAELLKASIYGPASVKTFRDAAEDYIARGGEARFLHRIICALGDNKLSTLSQDAIDMSAMKLYRHCAPSTQNRQFYSPVSAVLNHAAGKGWCSKRTVMRPRQPPALSPRWQTKNEAERLLAACNPSLRPLVLFMLYTGARTGEALYLDWKQVDLERRHVSFIRTKNGEARGVPLHVRVVEALSDLPHRSGAVFRKQNQQPYTKPNKDVELDTSAGTRIKSAFQTAVRHAGLEHFTPHGCRHTWATWHYMANKDLRVLQELGGWSSIMLVQRYAHVDQSEHRGSIDKI